MTLILNDRRPKNDQQPAAVTRGDIRTLAEIARGQRINAAHVQPVVRAQAAGVTTDGVTTNTTQTITGDKTFSGTVHAISTSAATAPKIERTSTDTNARRISARQKSTTTADMIDGFGAAIVFSIEDSAGVENDIAQVAAVRSGADNTGALVFVTYLAGVATVRATLNNTGLGIGNTPAQKLDVQGNIAVNGTKVIGAQGAAVTAAVYAAAAPTKAEFDALVDVVNALRARLTAHGLTL